MAVQRGGTGNLKGPVAMGAGSLRGAISGGGPQTVAGLMTAPREELQAVSAVPSGGRDLKAAVGGTDRISQSIRTRTSQGRVPRAGVRSLGQRPAFTGRPVGSGTGRKQVTGSQRRKQLSGRI